MSFSPPMQVAQGDAPLVTVLMSVYNGEKCLREAVDSILGQTFTDFEFLIINDGSTDGTKDILESYNDERMRIVDQENTGHSRSLNTGLHLARGEYVARMDADDVSHPARLELQTRVLDSNPHVDLVGAFYRVIDGDGRLLDHIEVETDAMYRLWILHFRNIYAHGSVTYRRRRVVDLNGYSHSCIYAEDYDLWLRLTGVDSAVIVPSYLYDLRIWPESISQRFPEVQQSTATGLSCRALRLCDPSLTRDDLAGMRPLYSAPEQPGNLTIAGLKSLRSTLEGFCARYGVDGRDKRTLLSRVTRDMMRGVMASTAISVEEKAVLPEILRTFTRDAITPEGLLGILWDETISVSNERNRLSKERGTMVVRLAVVVQRVLARVLVRYPAFQVVRRGIYALLKSAARRIRRIESSSAHRRTHRDA